VMVRWSPTSDLAGCCAATAVRPDGQGIGNAGLERRAGPPVCPVGAITASVFGHQGLTTGQFEPKLPRPIFGTTRVRPVRLQDSYPRAAAHPRTRCLPGAYVVDRL
jgi:hypothetical protein